MKAVFKKSALERVHELLMDADRQRRTIDYLLLTPEEWREICTDKWCRDALIPHGDFHYSAEGRISQEAFRTVTLASNRRNSEYPCRTFRIEPHVKLHGYDIVVAPAEFH